MEFQMAIRATDVTALLQVFDMRRSVAFYRDILGFEVIAAHEPEGQLHWAMLKLDQAVIMLNSRYEDDARPAVEQPVPSHGDVTLYFGCPDVEEAYQLLRSKPVALSPPVVTYYGMKQLTLADPDGYALCFQQKA